MSTGLLNIIKVASMDAVDNAQLCDIRYGTVSSTSPLKVKITNQLIIPQSLLVVPHHLTNYSVECTMSQSEESISGETEKSDGLKNEDKLLSEHTHKFTISTGGGESKQTIIINNALKVGDRVALLRQRGGQSYFILDRI